MPTKNIALCFFADGESVHTQRWLREMVKRDFDVTLITRRPVVLSGVKVFTVTDSLGKLGWLRRVIEIRKMVKKINPDIVHGHYITSYGFWAAASGVHPMVLTAWGSDILVTPKQNRLMRLLVNWTLSRADLATADSLDMIEEINRYSFKGEVLQIQWGVDLDLFKPKTKKNKTKFDILSLRTWSENYNIGTIIYAFRDFIRQRPLLSSSLYLLGSGPLEASLHKLVSDLGIEDRVVFKGYIPESLLPEVMGQCNVSLSVPSSDATAMSLLESMAMELPVIVSDLPANRQWITKKNGLIVTPRDTQSLTSALITIADNPDLQESMGKANRELVSRNASRKHEMDKMKELYNSILQKHKIQPQAN